MKFLVIEGNIGAGKTSLCEMLAAEKNAKLILEQFDDNPFLSKFYEHPERYAFPTELSFLSERYKQIKENLHQELFNDMVISDYFLIKSLIFSSKTLEKEEYLLYRTVFDIIFENIVMPDLYVYLHKTPESLLKNIKKRGREYEQNISEKYLKEIEEGYFNYFKQQNKIKILAINTDNLDFVNKEEDYKIIKSIIFEREHLEFIEFFDFIGDGIF